MEKKKTKINNSMVSLCLKHNSTGNSLERIERINFGKKKVLSNFQTFPLTSPYENKKKRVMFCGKTVDF